MSLPSSCSKPLSFSCWTQLLKKILVLIDSIFPYCESQWVPTTVWLPIIFKISSVFNRRKKRIQDWKNLRVSMFQTTFQWINLSQYEVWSLYKIEIYEHSLGIKAMAFMLQQNTLPAELQEHLLLRPEQHEAADVRVFSRCDLDQFICLSGWVMSFVHG